MSATDSTGTPSKYAVEGESPTDNTDNTADAAMKQPGGCFASCVNSSSGHQKRRVKQQKKDQKILAAQKAKIAAQEAQAEAAKILVMDPKTRDAYLAKKTAISDKLQSLTKENEVLIASFDRANADKFMQELKEKAEQAVHDMPGGFG